MNYNAKKGNFDLKNSWHKNCENTNTSFVKDFLKVRKP